MHCRVRSDESAISGKHVIDLEHAILDEIVFVTSSSPSGSSNLFYGKGLIHSLSIYQFDNVVTFSVGR